MQRLQRRAAGGRVPHAHRRAHLGSGRGLRVRGVLGALPAQDGGARGCRHGHAARHPPRPCGGLLEARAPLPGFQPHELPEQQRGHPGPHQHLARGRGRRGTRVRRWPRGLGGAGRRARGGHRGRQQHHAHGGGSAQPLPLRALSGPPRRRRVPSVVRSRHLIRLCRVCREPQPHGRAAGHGAGGGHGGGARRRERRAPRRRGGGRARRRGGQPLPRGPGLHRPARSGQHGPQPAVPPGGGLLLLAALLRVEGPPLRPRCLGLLPRLLPELPRRLCPLRRLARHPLRLLGPHLPFPGRARGGRRLRGQHGGRADPGAAPGGARGGAAAHGDHGKLRRVGGRPAQRERRADALRRRAAAPLPRHPAARVCRGLERGAPGARAGDGVRVRGARVHDHRGQRGLRRARRVPRGRAPPRPRGPHPAHHRHLHGPG
mmetsp:Transcript_21408/g.72047  ORF Transcript_21408/g.72047 Transcript_21408/m.72047 type:complete len:431 (-) Transcript_21408:300-1592(-)